MVKWRRQRGGDSIIQGKASGTGGATGAAFANTAAD